MLMKSYWAMNIMDDGIYGFCCLTGNIYVLKSTCWGKNKIFEFMQIRMEGASKCDGMFGLQLIRHKVKENNHTTT